MRIVMAVVAAALACVACSKQDAQKTGSDVRAVGQDVKVGIQKGADKAKAELKPAADKAGENLKQAGADLAAGARKAGADLKSSGKESDEKKSG